MSQFSNFHIKTPSPSPNSQSRGSIEEGEMETTALTAKSSKEEEEPNKKSRGFHQSQLNWLRMLTEEMHWTLLFGVVTVYGISQGLGAAFLQVASGYYWKDVQRLQPSEAQLYQGIALLPWIFKPMWGLFTDILPVAGYQRRPYLILAGMLGVATMLILSMDRKLCAMFALVSMTVGNVGLALADVTIDACVAQSSINHQSLASDMQSLCGLSSSIGGLLGFSISGLLIHTIGSQGVLGLLSIPSALIFSVGMVLKELRMPNFVYRQAYHKLLQANQTMWSSLKSPEVWRPWTYMYLTVSLSLEIQEGMFYWYTDPKAGPSFSQETVGFIFSFGSMGSLLGVLLYQRILKNYPFHRLLFWSQLLSTCSGILDLVLVMRLNLRLGISDCFLVVINDSLSQMIGRIRLMSLFVLSSELCPSGIEGTFFAFLMSIDYAGWLTASWGGSLLLHLLKVTPMEFGNLWVAIFIRNLMTVLALAILYVVPGIKRHSTVPSDVLLENEGAEAP